MKNLRITTLILSVLCAAFMTGCFSDGDPANISLSILQMKMHKAMDPDGNYRKSKTYVQKQMLVVKEGWSGQKGYIVETKFKRPDKMLIVTKEDNVPTNAIFFNGKNIWAVDYKKKTRTLLKGKPLKLMEVIGALGRPGNTYEDIFDEVNLFQSDLHGEPYYKVKCTSNFENQEPLVVYFYIGMNNYLTKCMDVPPYVTSTIDQYGLYDGIITPALITSTANGADKEYKLILYKLNVKIDDNEFFPPTF